STGKTGYIWSAGNFQAPATFLGENSKWNAASASSPWAYSGGGSWPGSAAEQKDGYTYDLNARGHGSDEGYGLATSTLEFTIDKLVPVPSVTNPAGGVPTNSVASINGSVQDSGAGVSSITIRIGDLWSASSPLSSPASYWNTTTGVWQDGVFESTVFVQGAPPFPSLQGWSRTTVLPAWQGGRKYRIENLAMDALGQTTSGGQIASIDFIYDVASPTETMTAPSVSADVNNPNWVNNFTGMSGAVQDDVTSALNTRTVYVRLRTEDNGKFWDPGPLNFNLQSSATHYWIPINTTGNSWSYAPAQLAGAMTPGFKYRIELWSKDGAGNTTAENGNPNPQFATAHSTGYFKFDNLPPTSAISFPANGAAPNAYGFSVSSNAPSVSTMTGTASDGVGESGIYQVQYRLYDKDANQYWCSHSIVSGSSCYGDPINSFFTLDVGEEAPWNVAFSTNADWNTWHSTGIPWISVNGHNFDYILRAADVAGNTQVSYSTVTFVYDSSAPTTFIQYPAVSGRAYLDQLTVISGTALDQPQPYFSGIAPLVNSGMRIGIQRQSDSWWWTSGNWSAARNDPAVSALDSSNPRNWSFSIPAGFWTPIGSTESFKVFVWAIDNVSQPDTNYNNKESSTSESGSHFLTFHYEVQPPSSTITAPFDSTWYSNTSPNNLPSISGTVFDRPQTSIRAGFNAANPALLEIRDEDANPKAHWNQSASSWSVASVFNTTTFNIGPVASTWSFNTATLISNMASGRTYRVRVKNRDAAYNDNNPDTIAGTEESLADPNAEPPNYDNIGFFNWDVSPPATQIKNPVSGSTVTVTPAVITGTASDPLSKNAGLGKIFVSIQREVSGNYLDALSGGGFNSGSALYFEASIWPSSFTLNTSNVTFPINEYYHVRARSSDTVNNLESISALEAADTNHIRFRYATPDTGSAMSVPGAGNPHYQVTAANQLTQLLGSAQYATTAQVLIQQTDNGFYWSGSSWTLSLTWLGVHTFTGAGASESWSFNFNSADWALHGNKNFKASIRAWDGDPPGGTVQSAQPAERTFVIDSTAPVVQVSTPPAPTPSDTVAFLNQSTTFYGTVDDQPAGTPGQIDAATIKFTLVRLKDNYEWSVAQSTFVPSGTALIGLPQSGNLYAYTTAYFQTGQAYEDGLLYRVKLDASDRGQNAAVTSTRTFRFDISSPTAVIDMPKEKTVVSSLPSITGAFSDFDPVAPLSNDYDPSGVSEVQLCIQRTQVSPIRYYQESPAGFLQTDSSLCWLNAAVYASSWVYTHASLNGSFTSGETYIVYARAKDKAGNVQDVFNTFGSSRPFVIDKDAPTVSITSPVDANKYTPAVINQAGNQIKGAASENPAGAGVANAGFQTANDVDVELSFLGSSVDRVLDGGSTYYWTGTGWSSTTATQFLQEEVVAGGWSLGLFPNSNSAADGASWAWAGDKEFRVRAKGRDSAVDGSSVAARNAGAYGSYVKFTVDATLPVSTATVPASSVTYVNSLPTISGTADGSLAGIKKMELRLVAQNGAQAGYEWTGSSWTNAGGPWWSTATLVGNGTTWYYNRLGGAFGNDVQYTFQVRATDNADQVQSPVYGANFVLDTSSPTLSFVRPLGPPEPPGYSNNAEGANIGTAGNPIAGASSDPGGNPSTVSEVWIAISTGTSGTLSWWSAGSQSFSVYQASVHWNQVSGGLASWTYAPAGLSAAFADNNIYYVFVKARDAAGNWRGLLSDPGDAEWVLAQTRQNFKYDTSRPTAYINRPSQSYHHKADMTTLSGTASDPNGATGSGLSAVEAAVQVLTGPDAPNYWHWTNAQFQAGGPFWTTAQNLSPWSTGTPAAIFTDALQYKIHARAKDKANNLQQTATEATFFYDVTAPAYSITFPANNGNYNLAALSNMSGGTTDATSQTSGVEILLKMQGTEGYWNGGTAGSIADWDTGAGKENNWRVATDTNPWTKSFPPLGNFSERQFTLWVRTTDYALNFSTTPNNTRLANNELFDGTPARQFKFDNTAPISVTTNPAQGAYIATSMTSIAGTSDETAIGGDAPSGVNNLKLKIKRSDGEYWRFDASTWTANATDPGFSDIGIQLLGTAPAEWLHTFPAAAWENGYQYSINPQGFDVATNVENSYSTQTFIVDLTTPTSLASVPVNSTFTATVPVLSGTADDSVENLLGYSGSGGRRFESGISTVQVAFQRLSDDYWWNGGAFTQSGSILWSTAVFIGDSSGTWSYDDITSLQNNTTFQLTVRAWDRAGHIQPTLTYSTFTFDQTAPSALATGWTGTPDGANYRAVTSIHGTAADDSPGQLSGKIQIRIRHHSGGTGFVAYWNPSEPGCGGNTDACWVASETWIEINSGTPANWTYNTSNVAWRNNGLFYIAARAKDRADNLTAAPAPTVYQSSFSFLTPSAVMTINQPPSPDFKHYRKQASEITAIAGTGANLRDIDNVRVSLQRHSLLFATSYWYNLTPQGWKSDASTYTSVQADTTTANFPWNITLPQAAYDVGNTSYTLTVRGLNSAGEETVRTRIFYADNTEPTAAISTPAANAYLRLPPTISGTASDSTNPNPPSIDGTAGSNVFVRLKDLTTNRYWDGTQFNQDENPYDLAASFSPAEPVDWSTATAAALLDGRQYQIFAHPQDKAGNPSPVVEGNLTSRFIYFDTSPAVGYVNQPSSAQVYMSLTVLTGTAADPAGVYGSNFSGLDKIEVQIHDQNGGGRWGGSAFNVFQSTYVLASGTDNWTYSNSSLQAAWVSGRQYVVNVRAYDKAGNAQSVFSVWGSSRPFYIDKSSPTTSISFPAHDAAYRPSAVSGGNALSGTAADADAALYPSSDSLQEVEYSLWYLQGGTSYYWDGASTFVSGGTQWQDLGNGSTTTWTYNFSDQNNWLSDKHYYLRARGVDRAKIAPNTVFGNKTENFTLGGNWIHFIVDNTPPVSKVSTPTAGSFIQNLNNLTGTSNSDLAGASTYYLRIFYTDGSDYYWSGNAATGWTTTYKNLPVAYSAQSGTTTVEWSYPGGTLGQESPTIVQPDGTVYKVAIQALDLAGNLETPTTYQFTKDVVGPTISISTPMASPNDLYDGTLRAVDPIRGVTSDSPAGTQRVEVQIENVSDGTKWDGSGWGVYGSTYLAAVATNPWTLSGVNWTGNKRYQVTVKAFDLAGNQTVGGAPNGQRLFVYDVNKPSATVSAPGGQFHNALQVGTSIYGTAQDWVGGNEFMSNLDHVQVKIIRNEDGFVYTGAAFTSGDDEAKWRKSTTVPAGFTPRSTMESPVPTWKFPDPGAGDSIPAWEAGKIYQVKYRAKDKAGNAEPDKSQQFTYDIAAPTTTITLPAASAYIPDLPAITGTYSDAVAVAISTIQVAIERNVGGNFFDGTNFSNAYGAASSWRPTTIYVSTWSLSSANLDSFFDNLTIPEEFIVYARGADQAQNFNHGDQKPGGGLLFTVDHHAPVSITTRPAQGANLNSSALIMPIAGTASDQSPGAGVNQVKIKLKRFNAAGTTDYWNLASWVGSDQGFPVRTDLAGSQWTNNTADITAADFQDGYRYEIITEGRDSASPA
ncbi:MAG: hypothetical protein HY611_00225, partial [Elusimicrobia bacterium]|nr:hypothetical protein [Elusimicrobiota bacterium]